MGPRGLRWCEALIDDRPKTVVQFVTGSMLDRDTQGNVVIAMNGVHKRKAFVLMAPYNHNLTDIPGVFVAPSWAGIRYYLQKEKLI